MSFSAVLVGDFQQPFELNVELSGVMSGADAMQIYKVQKSRMLHCAAVSVSQ